MGKGLKNTKAETITIRITNDVKERAQKLFEKIGTAATFASFLGDMVKLGTDIQSRLETSKQRVINEFIDELDEKRMYKRIEAFSQACWCANDKTAEHIFLELQEKADKEGVNLAIIKQFDRAIEEFNLPIEEVLYNMDNEDVGYFLEIYGKKTNWCPHPIDPQLQIKLAEILMQKNDEAFGKISAEPDANTSKTGTA